MFQGSLAEAELESRQLGHSLQEDVLQGNTDGRVDPLNGDHDVQEKPDVRTIFIQFLLSFLMDPDPMVIKDYLNCKTRLINLFR